MEKNRPKRMAVKNSQLKNADSEMTVSSSSDDEEGSVKLHQRKIKDLVCEYCEKSFKTHSALTHHKRNHKSSPIKCILCRSTFNYHGALMHHMKAYHPESKKHPCPYPKCEKSFDSVRGKNFHHKTHWRYMCKHCKKRFLVRDAMLSHVTKTH